MKKGLFFLFALLATFGLASCNSADVQSNKEKIAENQTKIAELNTAITTLQTKLEAADSELTKSIAKQIDDLKSELVTADSSAKAKLEKEISDLKAAQTSLANDLTTKTAQLKDTIDQKVAELGKDHDDLSKELTDKVAELNQKIETADNTVKTALETELNTLKEALEAVDATLATKEYVDTVKSGLEDSATALGNRVATLEADPTTKAYVDEQATALQTAVTGLAEVYETITNVAAAKQALEAADTALDARITALENGSATKEDVADLNEALETLAAFDATLATKEEVATLQTAITDLANVYETIANVTALKTALEAADAAMLERLNTLEAADKDFDDVADDLEERLAAIETLLTGQDISISEVFATINTKLTTLEATVATLADAAELKAATNRLDVLEALTGEESAVYLEKEVADADAFAELAGRLYVLEGTEYVVAEEYSDQAEYFEKVESIKVYYDAQLKAINDKLGDPSDELATYDENFVYQSGTLFGRIKAVEDRWANFNSDAVANKKAENVKKLTTIYTNFDNEMSELRAHSAERLAKETALAYAGNENYDSLEIKALLDEVFARIENEWKHMMEVYLFEGTTKIILAEQGDYFVKAGDGLATDEAIKAHEEDETGELVYLAEGTKIEEIDRIYYVYRDLLNSFNDEAKFTVEKEITKASISKFVYLQADHIAYTNEVAVADDDTAEEVKAVIKGENKNTVTLNTILTNVLAVNYEFSKSGSTTAQKKAYYDGKIAELDRWLNAASTLNKTYEAEENSKKLVEAITIKVEYTEIEPVLDAYLTSDEYNAALGQYGEVYVLNGDEYELSEAYAESTHYYYATTTGYLTESDKNAIFALYDAQIKPANYLAFALPEVQYTKLEPATGDYLTSDEYTAAKAQYGELYVLNNNEYVLSEAYAESTHYYVEKTLVSLATTDKDLMDLCVRRAYGFKEAKIYAVELKAQVAALQNLSADEKEALAARIDVVIDNYAGLTAADAPKYEINLNQVVTELELENPTAEATAEYEGARLTFDKARMNLYFEQALEYDRIVGYAKTTVTTIAAFDEISNDPIIRTVGEQEVEKTSNTWFKELINNVPDLENNYKKDFVLGKVVVTEDNPETTEVNEKVTRDETLAEATARIKGMLADTNGKSVADLQYADDKAEVDLYAQEATAYKDLIVASTEAINAIHAYEDNNVETIANPLILDFAKDGMDAFAKEVTGVRKFDNYYKEFTLEDVEVTDDPATEEVESGTIKETHAEAIVRLTKAIADQLGAAGTNDPKATSTEVDVKADGTGDKELVAALVYKARTYWTMLNYVDDCNEVLERVYDNETHQDIKDEIITVQKLAKEEFMELGGDETVDLYAKALLACASIADDEATTEANEAKSLRTVVDELAASKGANIDALIERVNVYMDLYYYTRVSETEAYERVQVGSYFFPVAEDNWNQYANAKTELWTLDFTGVNSNDLSEDSFYKKFYYTEVSAGIYAVATTWDPENINYYRVGFGSTVGNEEDLDFANNKYYVRFDNFAELKETGNLYKLVDQAYEQVSGSDEYNEDAKYYLRGTTAYYEKPITKATFVTDGSLYVLSQDVYTAVTEGEFNPAETYYGKATGTNNKINALENVPAEDAKKFINQYEFGRPQGTMKVRYVHVTEETWEQYGGDLLDVTFTQVQTPSQEEFNKLMYYTLSDGVYTLATGEFDANATYYEMYVVSLPVENPDWTNNYYVALSTSLGFLDTFDEANDNLKTVADWRQKWSFWKAAIDLSYYNATKYDEAMAYLADNLIVFEEVKVESYEKVLSGLVEDADFETAKTTYGEIYVLVNDQYYLTTEFVGAGDYYRKVANNISEADFYSGIYHTYNAQTEEYEIATVYDANATYYQVKGYAYFKVADVDALNTLLKACVNVENFLDDQFVMENEVPTTTHESDNTLAKAKADIDLVVTRAVSYNEALKYVYKHLLVFESLGTVTYEEVGYIEESEFDDYKQQYGDLYYIEDSEYGLATMYMGPYMYYKKVGQNISEETFNAGTYHTFDAQTNQFVLATTYDANAEYYQVKGDGFTSLRAQDVIEVNNRIRSFVTLERYTTLTGTAPQTDDQAIAAELAANKASIDLVLSQAKAFNEARVYAKEKRDAIAALDELTDEEKALDQGKVDAILDAKDYGTEEEKEFHINKYIKAADLAAAATTQLTADKAAMQFRYYHSKTIDEIRDRIEEAVTELELEHANKIDTVYTATDLAETHKDDVHRKDFIKNTIEALGDFTVELTSPTLDTTVYDTYYTNTKDRISTYSFFATRENAILTAILNSKDSINNATSISEENIQELGANDLAGAKAVLYSRLIAIYKANSIVTYDDEGNPSFTIDQTQTNKQQRLDAIKKVNDASLAIEDQVSYYLLNLGA